MTNKTTEKRNKYWIAGYYTEKTINEESVRVFEDYKVYTTKQLMKLGAVENVAEWYEDMYNVSWENISEKEKGLVIEKYLEGDECFMAFGYTSKKKLYKGIKYVTEFHVVD